VRGPRQPARAQGTTRRSSCGGPRGARRPIGGPGADLSASETSFPEASIQGSGRRAARTMLDAARLPLPNECVTRTDRKRLRPQPQRMRAKRPSARLLSRIDRTTSAPTKSIAKWRGVVICPALIQRRGSSQGRKSIRTRHSPSFSSSDRYWRDKPTSDPRDARQGWSYRTRRMK
jgi:hypothetical protein